ncbi:MAG: DUF6602 domain-containing protein [Proteocatella sp.]
MDGKRIQKYWSNEMKALLDTYLQFQTLIPSSITQGAAHTGEDGRYVEMLIKEYLKRYLPRNIEVLTGFILRPAVKTGVDSRTRKKEKDSHSTQLDILIYDSSMYPVFQRFGDSVIVPPEGVLGIISVKKTLHEVDIKNELIALKNAAKLCRCIDNQNQPLRGPYLALVSMNSFKKQKKSTEKWIFEKISECYSKTTDTFDETIGYIGDFNRWSIFKKKPTSGKFDAEYIFFEHNKDEQHLGFQFLLTGILSVYYDSSRNSTTRPGFTGFPSRRNPNTNLGSIKLSKLR